MENSNDQHCVKCGATAMPTASFCQACGERLPNNTVSVSETSGSAFQPRSQPAPEQEFRKLRLMNWAIVALVSAGAALMLIKSASLTGMLFVAAIMAFIVGSFLVTAIVLSRETIFLAGIPVGIHRGKLKKIAVVCNAIMGMFGVLGLIACLVTGQIAPMVSMLVYVVPPVLNFRALRALVLHS